MTQSISLEFCANGLPLLSPNSLLGETLYLGNHYGMAHSDMSESYLWMSRRGPSNPTAPTSSLTHILEPHRFSARKHLCFFCSRPILKRKDSKDVHCKVCNLPLHSICANAFTNTGCPGVLLTAQQWLTNIQTARKGKSQKHSKMINSLPHDLPPIRTIAQADLDSHNSSTSKPFETKDLIRITKESSSDLSGSFLIRQIQVRVTPNQTAEELETICRHRFSGHSNLKGKVMRLLASYRLYDDSTRPPHRLLRDEKPYRRFTELVFRQTDSAALLEPDFDSPQAPRTSVDSSQVVPTAEDLRPSDPNSQPSSIDDAPDSRSENHHALDRSAPWLPPSKRQGSQRTLIGISRPLSLSVIPRTSSSDHGSSSESDEEETHSSQNDSFATPPGASPRTVSPGDPRLSLQQAIEALAPLNVNKVQPLANPSSLSSTPLSSTSTPLSPTPLSSTTPRSTRVSNAPLPSRMSNAPLPSPASNTTSPPVSRPSSSELRGEIITPDIVRPMSADFFSQSTIRPQPAKATTPRSDNTRSRQGTIPSYCQRCLLLEEKLAILEERLTRLEESQEAKPHRSESFEKREEALPQINAYESAEEEDEKDFEDLQDRVISQKILYHALPKFPISPAESPYDRSFNFSHALWLLYCSCLTYTSDQCTQRISEIWRLDSHQIIQSTSMKIKAVLLCRNELAVLAFRGTETAENWKSNINYATVPFTEGLGILNQEVDMNVLNFVRIHRGFNVALMSLWEPLLAALVQLYQQKPNLQLYLTGHSLGGALAVIAWFYLVLYQPQFSVYGIYTFGQPRPGNKYFGQFMQRPRGPVLQRICNGGDPVPFLPPKRPYGFKHFGCVAYIDELGTIRFADDYVRGERFKKQGVAIVDHRTFAYVLAFRRHAELHSVPDVTPNYKLELTIIRAHGLPSAKSTQSWTVVREREGWFSNRTTNGKGAEPVWNETLEFPLVYYGQALIVEVWQDRSICGILSYNIYNFAPVDLIELPLMHPDHPQRQIGLLVVSMRFLLAKVGPEQDTDLEYQLFGTAPVRLLAMKADRFPPIEWVCPPIVTSAIHLLLDSGMASSFSVHDAPGFLEHELRELQDRFHTDPLQEFSPTHSPRLVWFMLLSWLASLREPIFGFDQYDQFMHLWAAEQSDWFPTPTALATILKAKLIDPLPEINRQILCYLFCLMSNLCANEMYTNQSSETLSQLFSRLLIFSRHPVTLEPIHIKEHGDKLTYFIEKILANWRLIFSAQFTQLSACFRFMPLIPPQKTPKFTFYSRLSIGRSTAPITAFSPILINGRKTVAVITESNVLSFVGLETTEYRVCATLTLPAGGWKRIIGLWDIGQRKVPRTLEIKPSEFEDLASLSLGDESTAVHQIEIRPRAWVAVTDTGAPSIMYPTKTGIDIELLDSTHWQNLSVGISCSLVHQKSAWIALYDGSLICFGLDGESSSSVLLPPKPIGRSISAITYFPSVDEVWVATQESTIYIFRAERKLRVQQLTPKALQDDRHQLAGLRCMIEVDSVVWCAYDSGKLVTIDLTTRKLLRIITLSNVIYSMLFIKPFYVIIGFLNGMVEVWSGPELIPLTRLDNSHRQQDPVTSLYHSEGTDIVWLGHRSGYLTLFEFRFSEEYQPNQLEGQSNSSDYFL